MHTTGRTLAVLALFVAAQPAAAQQGGTLTDGNATYIQGPAPTGESSAGPTGTTFRADPGAANQLFQNWWYYRVQGDTREYPFGTYTRSAGGEINGFGTFGINEATYGWTDLTAASVTRFTARYLTTLTDQGQPNTAKLRQDFTIFNPGTTALNIVLFSYFDLDVNGPSAIDTDLATGNASAITVSDGGFYAVNSIFGVPADAFQVAQFSGIRDSLLNNAVDNLTNSGVPFVGNFTGAFQWNLTVPAGGSVMVNTLMTIAPVPEPGTLALTGAAVAAGLWRWRRRRGN
jgi:hypothetical protein